MPKILKRSLFAMALFAASGFGTVAAGTQSQALSLPGYPAVGAPATVTLSSAGAEPRARLRFKPTAGSKETMSMSTGVSMSMQMAGMSMPQMDLPIMKMAADIAVKSVSPEGDIVFDLAYTEMTTEALPGMDPTVAAAMQSAGSGITALKGTFTLTNRGMVKSSTLNMDAITDPSLRQTLSTVSSSLQNLMNPLPEEAVGAGAKWEVRQATSAMGAVTFQKILCELVSMDAQTASIKMTIEQTIPPQTIANPVAPGMTMNVEKASGTGSGTTTVKFASMVPTSEMLTNVSMTMSMDMGGQTQQITADTKVKMNIGPRK